MKLELDINSISFSIDNDAVVFIKQEVGWVRCGSKIDDAGVPIISTYNKSYITEGEMKKELPKVYHHIVYLPEEKSVLITVKERKK